MFVAQPTLSQQIRRLEEIVGTQLLERRREGLQLTKAGAVLLDASRTVLSLVDHEVNRTRQAAGLGRPRLRVVVPPRLPDAFAVEAASALRSAAAAADVDFVWLEAALDAGFSLIAQRRADAGLGWLTDRLEALPAPLDVRPGQPAPGRARVRAGRHRRPVLHHANPRRLAVRDHRRGGPAAGTGVDGRLLDEGGGAIRSLGHGGRPGILGWRNPVGASPPGARPRPGRG
jgi:DNA-binding transcriptional LysR family regulator